MPGQGSAAAPLWEKKARHLHGLLSCQFFLKLAMNTNISELRCVATPLWANGTGRGGQFVLCGGVSSPVQYQ